METPAREHERALEGLAPVRLEFAYADRKLLRLAAISMAVLFAGLFGYMALALRSIDGAVCVPAAFLVGFESWIAVWYHLWLRRGPQVVELSGTTLRVIRCGVRGDVFEQVFNILEIHDLRVSTAMYPGRYTVRFPLQKNYGQGTYWVPEPIQFTYHGRACSFGGDSTQLSARQSAFQTIVEFDSEVRRRLGMTVAPSIETYDVARVALALEDSWDVDVPARVL